MDISLSFSAIFMKCDNFLWLPAGLTLGNTNKALQKRDLLWGQILSFKSGPPLKKEETMKMVELFPLKVRKESQKFVHKSCWLIKVYGYTTFSAIFH